MSASEFGKDVYGLAESEISHRIFGDKIYDAGNDAFNKQVKDATNAALKTGQYTSLEGTVEQTPNINEPRTALRLMAENAQRVGRLIEAQKALEANHSVVSNIRRKDMSEKVVISKIVGGLREESEVIVGGEHPDGLQNLTDFLNDQNHSKPQTQLDHRTDLFPMPEMASDLSAEVIAGIKREQSSGKIRMIAGRPWWVSSFSLDELKGAGLI